MAETYRGLTVRIGGDTSSLQKALRAANGSIAETNRQLRTLGQAAKFDPANVEAMNLQVSYMGQQAESSAYRLSTLRESIAQLSTESNKCGVNLKEMSDNTKNASLTAEVMRDKYSRLTSSLAEQFTQITKWSKEFGSKRKINVEAGMTGWDKLNEELDRILKKIDEMKSSAFKDKDAGKFIELEGTENEINETRALLEKLKPEFTAAFDGLKTANAVVEFEQLNSEVVKSEAKLRSLAREFVETSRNANMSEVLGEYREELSGLDSSIESAANRFKVLDAAFKIDPSNVKVADERLWALNDVSDLSAKKVQKLNEAMSKLDTSGFNNLLREYGSLENAVEQTTKKAEKAFADLQTAREALSTAAVKGGFKDMLPDILDTSKQVDGLTDEVNDLRAVLPDLEQRLKDALDDVDTANACNEFQQLRTEALSAGTAVQELTNSPDGKKSLDEAAFQQAFERVADLARQAASAIVESANTIDAAYRDMRKTVEGTETEFSKIREEAIKFSQTHFTSADTILEMEALGGQLGVATSALQEFGETMSSVVIATDIEAEQAALQFGQLTNVMSDLDDTTFDNVADALVRLGNTTATTESAIMNVAQRMSSVANVTSMTTPQLLAWSAAIASTGQRAESASTAISNTITGISAAVAEGGDTLQQFANIAGMSADEFKERWENSSSEALEAFVKGLSTLSDSSTAAIAALESVGISSVRQETALLGLSQTIDNLDEAMANSIDAFNGGGDAAREAGKKAEGFSGSLAMMQNNAANLAASLGDGLIPFMKALSSVMALITDAFNALPGPVKTTIVEMGGFAAVLGIVAATLKGLGLDYVVKGLMNVQSAAGLATLATHELAAAMSKIPMLLAITTALTALNAFIGMVGDAVEHTNMLRDATESLENAYQEFVSSYESVRNAGEPLSEVRQSADDALASVAAFGESMHDTWSRIGTDVGTAERYAETIKELGNQGSISVGELSLLKEAVKGYNDITGSSVEIINDQTGALNINSDSIDKVTSSYENFAKTKAYSDIYQETTRKIIETTAEIERLNDAIAEAEKKNMIELGVEGLQDYQKAKDDLEALTKAQDRYNDILEDCEHHLENTSSSYDDYGTELVKAGKSTEDFLNLSESEKQKLNEVQAELSKTGDSLTSYGDLNESQLKEIVGAWDGNVSKVISLLNRIQEAGGQAASDAASFKPSDEMVAAFKRSQEDIYDAAKRAYDDDYANYKSSLDDKYDALKSSLDATYRDAKSAYDADYKNLKQNLDAEYDYAKKTYDAEYKGLKDTLDKEYKARQKALDSEYKAAQRESQAYLKQYEKGLDDQVSAFKKSTDAKLSESKKTHEKELKLLEAQTKKQTDEIDRRIAELKKLSEADDKEKRDRERADKKAELEENVRHAKTRRKKAEAEKELSDYLRDIALEDAKEQRELEIENLEQKKKNIEEEASTRKDALKESYDEQIEAYKEARAAELEALREANQAEYERRQEAETARLEQLKESQSAQLEAVKEANDLQLESIKSWQSEQLEAIKANNDATLQSQKDFSDAELQSMKDSNDAALAELKRANEQDLTVRKRANEDRLNELKRAQADDLEVYKQAGQDVSGVLGAIELGVNETANNVTERVSDANQKLLNEQNRFEKQVGGNVRLTTSEIQRDAKSTFDNLKANSKALSGDLANTANDTASSLKQAGNEAGNGYAAGIENGGQRAVESARDISSSIGSTMSDPASQAVGWGWDMLVNFANGASDAWDRGGVFGVFEFFGQQISDMFKHSKPKSGPLRDDDVWFYHMMQNLADGFESGTPLVYRQMRELSNGMSDMSTDLMGGIVSSMREHEGELARQAERMAEIVERGFDPEMTVDAAYEAIDRIRAGRAREQAALMSSSNSTQNVSINVNLSGVSIREDADITKLVDEIERRMAASNARRNAAAIGGARW